MNELTQEQYVQNLANEGALLALVLIVGFFAFVWLGCWLNGQKKFGKDDKQAIKFFTALGVAAIVCFLLV